MFLVLAAVAMSHPVKIPFYTLDWYGFDRYHIEMLYKPGGLWRHKVKQQLKAVDVLAAGYFDPYCKPIRNVDYTVINHHALVPYRRDLGRPILVEKVGADAQYHYCIAWSARKVNKYTCRSALATDCRPQYSRLRLARRILIVEKDRFGVIKIKATERECLALFAKKRFHVADRLYLDGDTSTWNSVRVPSVLAVVRNKKVLFAKK